MLSKQSSEWAQGGIKGLTFIESLQTVGHFSYYTEALS